MNPEKSNQKNKIMSITLGNIPKLIESCLHKSFSYQILCFVGRLISKGDYLIFSDETGILNYEMKNTQKDLILYEGYYYQCLAILKNFSMSFRVQIINIREVDSNYIALHMIRIMKQKYLQKTNQFKHESIKNIDNLTNSDKYNKNIEIIYFKMRNWCEEKGQFTADQLQNAFNEFQKTDFDVALEKMEDQELIGNMGEYYKWI